MRPLFGLSLIFFLASSSLAQQTIESIPNQKLIDGSYVSNPDKILDAATVSQINFLLESLESKTTVQVAVVVVQSIGEADIFEFAQQLFVTWGIGQKEKDNGLLLLFVGDQHTIRFHTGFGLEGVLTDAMCKRIQRDHMVPEFKDGNYNAGMLAGLSEVNRILIDPTFAEELKETEDNKDIRWANFLIFLTIVILPVLLFTYYRKSSKGKFADSKNPGETAYAQMYMNRWPWLIIYIGIPFLIVLMYSFSRSDSDRAYSCYLSLYFYYLSTRFYRLWKMQKVIRTFVKNRQYYEVTEFLGNEQRYWFWMAVLFPFPFLFYYFYHRARKRIYRNHPRQCKQCQAKMVKLNEKKEDEYLSAGMQMEEKLNVVDYDVWKCTNQTCSGIEIWHYLTRQSKYQSCPKCQTLAYHFVSSRTITPASYVASGVGEQVHACVFCSNKNVTTYEIPKYVEDTSDSSSSSGSSDGGGSWGGGDSGGGGASSSW